LETRTVKNKSLIFRPLARIFKKFTKSLNPLNPKKKGSKRKRKRSLLRAPGTRQAYPSTHKKPAGLVARSMRKWRKQQLMC